MQKTRKGNQQGFTLIELIAVMVILGILAVVAVPKYMDMSKEAAAAQVQGVVGAMNSAIALDFAHTLAKGNDYSTEKPTSLADVVDMMERVPGGTDGDWAKLTGTSADITISGNTFTISLVTEAGQTIPMVEGKVKTENNNGGN